MNFFNITQAFSEISGVITQYYSVTNLSPYTEYEMYVIAVNNIGRGPPSAPAVITTGETGIFLFGKLILFSLFLLQHVFIIYNCN